VSAQEAIGVGGIDWAGHWRQLVEARQAADAVARPTPGDRWAARAGRFAQLTQQLDPAAHPFVQALTAELRSSDTVLDVGAGAGRFALAIAPAVARVTAVEPSPGMRAAFERTLATRGVPNVQLIPGSWPDVEIAVHDVAFVADVLYFVPDAVPFIEKLDRSAMRACYLLHRVDEMAASLGELRLLVNPNRPPEPGATELYNLLAAIGIQANVRIIRTPASAPFATREEVIAEVRLRLGLNAEDHAHDEQIRSGLEAIMSEADDGFRFRRRGRSAMLWWEKEPQPA
jgi:SAM-dependent methyltransferase